MSLFCTLLYAPGQFHTLPSLLKLSKAPPQFFLTENDLAAYFTNSIEQSEENVHVLDHQVANRLTG